MEYHGEMKDKLKAMVHEHGTVAVLGALEEINADYREMYARDLGDSSYLAAIGEALKAAKNVIREAMKRL